MAESQVTPTVETPAAPVQQQLDISPEDRLAAAAGLADTKGRVRDEQGRFVKAEDAAAAAVKEPTEESAEPRVEPKVEAEDKTPAEGDAEEIQWDAIKALKVKVPMKNGDKEWVDEVTFEDLRNQRMMHADYMARRREVDTEKQEAAKSVKEHVEKERNQFLGALNVLHQSVIQAADAELANVDWQKLATEDPARYVQLQARAQLLGSTLQRIAAESQRVRNQQEEEHQATLQTAIGESKAKLKEAIPTWNDELYQSLLKRGVETYHFKPEEIGQAYDHRVMQVLHDAHQYRLMKEQKPASEKKVAAIPPVLRPGAITPKVNPQVQELRKAQERLRKDPRNIDAAADVMKRFIGG